jgi:hypothetical protein
MLTGSTRVREVVLQTPELAVRQPLMAAEAEFKLPLFGHVTAVDAGAV